MRFSASKPASSHEAVACGKNIRVSSIYDPSADSITRTRELFPEIAIHESYNSLLAEPGIDWVMIGSWNSQHAEQAIQALEAGNWRPASMFSVKSRLRHPWTIACVFKPSWKRIRNYIFSSALSCVIRRIFSVSNKSLIQGKSGR